MMHREYWMNYWMHTSFSSGSAGSERSTVRCTVGVGKKPTRQFDVEGCGSQCFNRKKVRSQS
jgi:hypothetical protein